ncbi:MAG: DUF1549 and DUF1553 domain-containing protein [Gemmataceae bacterium]|nr:DUF1549 and DUF1553 domain-containing protein [Gemmataceae bacterium]
MATAAGKLWICCVVCLLARPAMAADRLHTRIDALIASANGTKPTSARTDDAEFLRRVYLDLAGRIPSGAEARSFLEDRTADKREKLIDQLLSSPDYSRRMQDAFHVMLMERMGDNADWAAFLRKSFENNKPWNQLAREILAAAPKDEATRGAAFFYAKRLENYGQNPVDYPALTRDVGRLFLGMDLKCAQCHDHLFIKTYKQQDFQGLSAFFQNTFLQDAKFPTIGEKPLTQKVAYMSVMRKDPKTVGPRIPGMNEIDVPTFKKGEEYTKAPDPKAMFPGVLRFSPLALLAEQLPTADNALFTRNIVNRLWFLMMGRGLVHPLDLHHRDNPPSHPELLDLLAREFVAHQFDVKWLLRELALSETYQRSSILPKGEKPTPESYRTANEKRISADQLLWAILEATGERAGKEPAATEALRQKFVRAFAGPRREPEDEISPSLKAALFVLNDDTVLTWLTAQPGNLIERLSKLEDDKVGDELYLSVLTRQPTVQERQEVVEYLKKKSDRRAVALGHLTWALLASTEFCVNH